MRALLVFLTAVGLVSCFTVAEPDDDDSSGGEAGDGGGGGKGGSPTGGTAGDVCLGAAGSPTAAKGCGCTRDCDVGEECAGEALTGAPGGLCISLCSEADPCPNGLACIELTPGDPRTANCQQPCATTDECRPGYLCEVWPPDTATVDTFCLPYCQDDADCPATGTCNRYSGECGTAPPLRTKPDGEVCVADSECRSELCLEYCTSFCSMSRQGCPDGLVCSIRVWEIGDMGGCQVPCTTPSDCPTGTSCYPSALPDVTACH